MGVGVGTLLITVGAILLVALTAESGSGRPHRTSGCTTRLLNGNDEAGWAAVAEARPSRTGPVVDRVPAAQRPSQDCQLFPE
jgi:hypothetical protein